MPNGVVENPLVFVSIAGDGIVTITCHRAEMGQGVRTGVPMILADELEADWAKVRVVQAPGDEVRYGNQDTDGSRTTRHFFMPMRRCGAAARQMLESAAAARWGVPASEVQREEPPADPQAQRPHASASARWPPTPPSCRCRPSTDLRLKKPAEFRYIGKGKTPLIDGFDMTTGKAVYGMDVVLPDMLFAVVARTPVYGGTLRGFDAAEAMKVPGVREGGRDQGLAGPERLPAAAGRGGDRDQHLGGDERPQGAQARLGRRPERAAMHRTATAQDMEAAAAKPGKLIRNHGDVDAAMKTAAKTREGAVLHAAPDAGADGAAGRGRAHQGRRAASCGARSRARRRCATTSPSGSI